MHKVIKELNADRGLVTVQFTREHFIAKVAYVGEYEGREIAALKDKEGKFHKLFMSFGVMVTVEPLVDFVPSEEVAITYNEDRLKDFPANPVAPANVELVKNNNAVVARTPLQFA